jgi:hypothetical protein
MGAGWTLDKSLLRLCASYEIGCIHTAVPLHVLKMTPRLDRKGELIIFRLQRNELLIASHLLKLTTEATTSELLVLWQR